MAFIGFPFTSNVEEDEHGQPIYDRAVGADFLQNLYKIDRGNGIVMLIDSTSCQVLQTSPASRYVTINPGYCFINGIRGYNDELVTVEIDAADSSLPRIDTIALRLDVTANKRCIEPVYIKGTPAQTPTIPPLVRTAQQYDLGIADIYIPSASTVVEQQFINDTRLKTERCGESLPLQAFDTTGLYDQMRDVITKNFDLIKSALDDTTAGFLQNQITDIVNNKLYPVGSFFFSDVITDITSQDSRCPWNFIVGSQWSEVKNAVIRAGTPIGYFGSDSLTLNVNQLAPHTHNFTPGPGKDFVTPGPGSGIGVGQNSGHEYPGHWFGQMWHTTQTGGGQAINILPRVKNLAMFRRDS
ncbi:MAG: hypothetical protein Q4E88_02720 [Coriobacteriia bacterium]|nr:hypothetical protein [Coriobacteriia bacterium]